jgi:hypothetical protein
MTGFSSFSMRPIEPALAAAEGCIRCRNRGVDNSGAPRISACLGPGDAAMLQAAQPLPGRADENEDDGHGRATS